MPNEKLKSRYLKCFKKKNVFKIEPNIIFRFDKLE